MGGNTSKVERIVKPQSEIDEDNHKICSVMASIYLKDVGDNKILN